jgi:outer membrane lipoprotein LolB
MRGISLALLCALLSGCAWFRPAPVSPPLTDKAKAWAQHQAAVVALESFQIEGRVAIKRGTEGGSVKLRWQQRGFATDLRLMAPLAQGSFHLERNADGVALTGPDGQRHRAADLEALMQSHLQWSFPVEGARYWVRGVPDPKAKIDHLTLDAAGHLSALAQSGWQISVLAYREVAGYQLPAKLLLVAGNVQLRLVIDQWELTRS